MSDGVNSNESGEGAESNADTGAQPSPGRVQDAPFRHKFWLAVFLVLSAAASLWGTGNVINRLNEEALAEVSVGWTQPEGVDLGSGPAGFHYDAATNRLTYRGAISDERKLAIQALFVPRAADTQGEKSQGGAEKPKGPAEAADSRGDSLVRSEAQRREYRDAIDHLAFLASARQSGLICLVLLLGGLGGALGAILRSLVDFVGNACYTRNFDLTVWWPLYATRPVVGAMLGFVLVVLMKARLITAGHSSVSDDSLWWLGISIVGGFSTLDVTQRLRLAAKAMFGVESERASGKNSIAEKGKSAEAGTATAQPPKPIPGKKKG